MALMLFIFLLKCTTFIKNTEEKVWGLLFFFNKKELHVSIINKCFPRDFNNPQRNYFSIKMYLKNRKCSLFHRYCTGKFMLPESVLISFYLLLLKKDLV